MSRSYWLTPDQIAYIRSELARGIKTHAQIADNVGLGIDRSVVSRIASGKRKKNGVCCECGWCAIDKGWSGGWAYKCQQLRALADYLEQREQPAAPPSTRPQELDAAFLETCPVTSPLTDDEMRVDLDIVDRYKQWLKDRDVAAKYILDLERRIADQVEETKRLDWIIKTGMWCLQANTPNLWSVFIPGDQGEADWKEVAQGKTPRQAIDAARGKES